MRFIKKVDSPKYHVEFNQKEFDALYLLTNEITFAMIIRMLPGGSKIGEDDLYDIICDIAEDFRKVRSCLKMSYKL